MTINTRTEVHVYCDGGVHQGLEFTVSSAAPLTEAKTIIRRSGWTIKRDGRVLCPKHAKEQK